MTPDQYRREGARAMQEAAARYIDKRLADYIKEHGTYDPTTGVTEFPGNGEEWTFEQEETAAAIRAINPTTVLARLPPAPDPVARLVEAVKNERHHKSAYDATQADRGGHKGSKGQAYVLWCEARADVGTALAAMDASHDRT